MPRPAAPTVSNPVGDKKRRNKKYGTLPLSPRSKGKCHSCEFFGAFWRRPGYVCDKCTGEADANRALELAKELRGLLAKLDRRSPAYSVAKAALRAAVAS